MSAEDDEIYLGFDPGGDSRFGVAILHGSRLQTYTVNDVDEAIEWATNICGERNPKAAGLDTLLHWATGKAGLRPCDEALRTRYPAARASVMSPNSLYGAMVIGGMSLAIRLRQKWPNILLNETHPKVFLHAFGKVPGWNVEGDHANDAALSAWATRRGIEKCWPDIIGPKENLIFPEGNVHYLWPSETASPYSDSA